MSGSPTPERPLESRVEEFEFEVWFEQHYNVSHVRMFTPEREEECRAAWDAAIQSQAARVERMEAALRDAQTTLGIVERNARQALDYKLSPFEKRYFEIIQSEAEKGLLASLPESSR